MNTRRRSVALTPPQLHWLARRAKELGITIADLIRRIIDEKREKES